MRCWSVRMQQPIALYASDSLWSIARDAGENNLCGKKCWFNCNPMLSLMTSFVTSFGKRRRSGAKMLMRCFCCNFMLFYVRARMGMTGSSVNQSVDWGFWQNKEPIPMICHFSGAFEAVWLGKFSPSFDPPSFFRQKARFFNSQVIKLSSTWIIKIRGGKEKT